MDATKTLIKLRGERELDFEHGGARKNQLWVEISHKMRSYGYDFTAEKVSKKWHNIMITYNKNIRKKETTGIVNWEFFEDIDVYYKTKRIIGTDEDYDVYPYEEQQLTPSVTLVPTSKRKSQLHDDTKYTAVQDFVAPDTSSGSLTSKYLQTLTAAPKVTVEPDLSFKKIKLMAKNSMLNGNNSHPTNGEHSTTEISDDEIDQSWWKEYFNKKLELEREKMKREQERHKDNMNYQKMALMMQERADKTKVEAINNLTNAISKLTEVRKKS